MVQFLNRSRVINFFISNKNYLILVFTLVYVLAFIVNAYENSNNEFLYYTVLQIGLIYVVILVHRHLRLGFFILFNLSLLGFLHLLGGNYHIGAVRLYDYWLIPETLKYDNLVHTFGTFVTTLTLYTLTADFIDQRIRQRFGVFGLMLALMAIGVGTLNEVVEFIAVVFLGAAEQVGGYFNNSLDVIFNVLGSILGCVVIYLHMRWPIISQKINEKINKNN